MGQVSILESLTLHVDEGQQAQADIKGKVSDLWGRLGKIAKNQSLPAHLQEKDSRGEDNITLYEHHEKPTTWWSRPSLSNPRSTNDIVWAFSRANPTQLGSLRFVSLQGLLAKIISVFTRFLVAIVYDLNLVNLAHPFYQ